jgi:hypothetical protein
LWLVEPEMSRSLLELNDGAIVTPAALHLSDGVVDLVEQDIDLALRNGPLADSALRLD